MSNTSGTTPEVRPVAGYPDYEVSSDGRVFSNKPLHKGGLYIMTQTRENSGRYSVALCKGGKKHRVYVDKLVAGTYIFNPESLPEVGHIDGDEKNNDMDNLFWTSVPALEQWKKFRRKNPQATGMVYCVESGRVYRGVKHAAEILGYSASKIRKAIRNHTALSGYSLHLRYLLPEDQKLSKFDQLLARFGL